MKIITKNINKGFTLIELIVAIFIFSLILIAIVSVFVSTTTAYSKGRAIKTIKENTEFALSSIAKDVRMGKIESGASDRVVITRNRGLTKVCYLITFPYKLNACDGSCGGCSPLIDLSGTGMSFGESPAFRSQPTQYDASGNPVSRGWVEINLNVKSDPGQEMSADQINVQTTVSSRDYGWQEVAP
jgi:prepilin-type N-terminal cleavage/methylation domain-containing protein